MGVQGLWQLLEPAGKPVDPSTLNGKVLAVDASIWLHQLMKGFRDKDGNPLPNAHLLGVFYRVCKLIGYGIKPVFVFDGGVPVLKRQTLAGRRQKKIEALDKSELTRQKLLSNFLKQQLQRKTGKVVPDELEEDDEGSASASNSPRKKGFGSPTKKGRFQDVDQELLQFREKFAAQVEPDDYRGGREKQEDGEESEEEDYGRWKYGMNYAENFSAINSKDFDTLPLETQHEILFEMQESRKMNSWGRMDKMPQNLQDFSSYQMDRLVKRRFLQKKIRSVQQEMGQRHIHVQNLDELLKMNYDFGEEDELKGSQDKGFMYVKKTTPVKKAPDDGVVELQQLATQAPKEECELMLSESDSSDDSVKVTECKKLQSGAEKSRKIHSIPQMEEDEQLALAIQMSLEECKNSNASITNQPGPSSSSKVVREKPKEVIPSSLPSSCSKFLDTVGFSSRAQDSSVAKLATKEPDPLSITTNGTAKESSDSDEDDFEAVELSPPLSAATVTQKPTIDERKMVEALLSERPALVNDSERNSEYAIATINLTDIVSENPQDEDIFADIFDDDSTSKSETADPVSVSAVSVEESPKSNTAATDFATKPPTQPAESSSEPEFEEIQDRASLSPVSSVEKKADDASSSNVPAPAPANATIARTLGKIPNQGAPEVRMITAEYMQEQARLNKEHDQLLSEKGFQERVATSLSEQMNIETQELLGLFGIPYIISPMEAESQCAFLDMACLTDGTITDDSDCWLFGSLRAYKNFYSSGNKHIEFYQLADITKSLNLDRDKLILIALLSGGDYCDGIDGVGPVTALEILSEFSHESSSTDAFEVLLKFREWWDLVNEPAVEVPDLSKVRQKLKKLKLSPGFPSRAVYDAYMNPTIDSSTEPFRWGLPDIDAIRAYTQKRFGWDSKKCDAMVLPVLKRLECQADKSKQLTLDTFLVSRRFDLESHSSKRKKGSKRLLAAFEKLKRQAPEEVALSESDDDDNDDDEEEEAKPPPRKQKKTEPAKKQYSKSSTKLKPSQTSSNDAGPSRSLEEINRSLHSRKTKTSIPQTARSEAKKAANKRKAVELMRRTKK